MIINFQKQKRMKHQFSKSTFFKHIYLSLTYFLKNGCHPHRLTKVSKAILIIWSLNFSKQNRDSYPSALTIGSEGNFMFGIRVPSFFNPHSNKRYVDIVATQLSQEGSIRREVIHLQQCTRDHWKPFPSINMNLDFSLFLCPPINSNFSISGSFLSQNQQTILLQVLPCSNSSNIDSICDSQEEIYKFLYFTPNILINFIYANPIIDFHDDSVDFRLESRDIFLKKRCSKNYQYLSLPEFYVQANQIISKNKIDYFSNNQIQSILNKHGKYEPKGYLQILLVRSSKWYPEARNNWKKKEITPLKPKQFCYGFENWQQNRNCHHLGQ